MRGPTAKTRSTPATRSFRYCLLGIGLLALICSAPSAAIVQAEGPALPPPPAPQLNTNVQINAVPNTEPGQIDPVLLKKLSKPGDLTLKNSTLTEALFSISASWKINIVIGDNIKGQVNGVFQDAPLHEILNSILLTNGYSYRPVGQSLVVMSLKDLGDNNPLFETAIIPITNGKPEDIVNGIKILASQQGKLQVINSAHAILVTDFPDHVAKLRSYARQLDQATQDGDSGSATDNTLRMQVLSYRPQFVEAKYLKDAVTTMLSKEGKVATMDLDNRVVVHDFPSQLRSIQVALQQLDVPRLQVRITAYIYDLNLQDVENLGVNWDSAAKGRLDATGKAGRSLSLDSLTQAVAAAGATNGALTFSNLSSYVDLTAVVQALNTCSNSRLLGDPQVSVYDGELATFSSVTEHPYQQLTQTGQGGNIGTTAFREAGVKLQVTPRIAEDGTIRIECNPSFSRLAGFTTDASAQPIIDRREAKSTVRVANGQTFVIGGLRTRTDVKSNAGIPGLKDIPGLGWFFRSHSNSVTETELVVFVKPEIVSIDYRGKTREQAAAETVKCGLGYVPRAEGCNGCCGEPTMPIDCQGAAVHKPIPECDELPPGFPTGESTKRTQPVQPSLTPPIGPDLRQPSGYVSKPVPPGQKYQPVAVASKSNAGSTTIYSPASQNAPTTTVGTPSTTATVSNQSTPAPWSATPSNNNAVPSKNAVAGAKSPFEALPPIDPPAAPQTYSSLNRPIYTAQRPQSTATPPKPGFENLPPLEGGGSVIR